MAESSEHSDYWRCVLVSLPVNTWGHSEPRNVPYDKNTMRQQFTLVVNQT